MTLEIHPPFSSKKLPYKRILLKLSGEALMGDQPYGFDFSTINRLCNEIKEVHELGVEQIIVIGGGNIFRGLKGEGQGIERTTSDHMGMLATVMNALALQSKFEQLGLKSHVMSAISMPSICESYSRRKAIHHIEKRHVIICAAGTGDPYFTTDTAAALRACELNCQILMKGTKVDGVYSADPVTHKDAIFYPELTYQLALTENLKVMDAAAISLAREKKLPIMVFSIQSPQGIINALRGKGLFTLIR